MEHSAPVVSPIVDGHFAGSGTGTGTGTGTRNLDDPSGFRAAKEGLSRRERDIERERERRKKRLHE